MAPSCSPFACYGCCPEVDDGFGLHVDDPGAAAEELTPVGFRQANDIFRRPVVYELDWPFWIVVGQSHNTRAQKSELPSHAAGAASSSVWRNRDSPPSGRSSINSAIAARMMAASAAVRCAGGNSSTTPGTKVSPTAGSM